MPTNDDMTDRELLERAARAAGIELALPANVEMRFDELAGDFVPWNPLTDDGDALRLAVKLGIEIRPDKTVCETSTAFMVGSVGRNTWESWGPLRDGSQDDADAATRRAIVRAAASMAPTQEEKQTS